MPSEAPMHTALEAVSDRLHAFRATVAAAAQQVRGYRDALASGKDERVARINAELGHFAAGRIDVERFASYSKSAPAQTEPPTAALGVMDAALQALLALAARENEAFVVDVAHGDSLHDAVDRALAEIGRSFAAVRLAELTKGASNGRVVEKPVIEPLPFRAWSQTQRRLAPPLVVHVDGSDLYAGALAEFLDGTQKIILVVRGAAPPAPLVRLITPDAFVVQTTDGSELGRMMAWDGPGVAAIVPESAARFVHDPTAGPALAQRLSVGHMPAEASRKTLGGLTAAQQAGELAQLRALAARAAEPAAAQSAAGAPAPDAGDDIDKLANWLISQAGLD